MTEDLPPGWEWVQLQDIAAAEPRAITDGPFGSNLKTAHYTDDGPRVIRLQNIGDGVFKSEDAHIAQEHYESLERHAVRAGDLIVASLGEVLPRACLVPDWVPPAIVKADCIRVRLHSGVNAAYVNYALQLPRLRQATAANIKGVGRPRLGMQRIKELSIPLAPRAEQDRIVAAVDEHSSHLDAAETALLAAQQKVDALLRAVVGEECRGSWETVPLAEVITSLRNGVFVSRPAAKPPGQPIYRISAVRPLRLRTADVRYALPVPKGADEYVVNSGDVLFTRYSGNPSYVGAAAVVPDAGSGVMHPDKLIRVVIDRAQILPEWLAAYVSVGEGRRQVEMRLKTTAGQVGISGSQLKSVPVAVPSLDYQRSAVARIAGVMADQKVIELQLTTLQAKSSALRRSILACAFAGLLLPWRRDGHST